MLVMDFCCRGQNNFLLISDSVNHEINVLVAVGISNNDLRDFGGGKTIVAEALRFQHAVAFS